MITDLLRYATETISFMACFRVLSGVFPLIQREESINERCNMEGSTHEGNVGWSLAGKCKSIFSAAGA